MTKQVSMYIKISLKGYIPLLIILLLGCSESKYSTLVKTEMSKGIVNDSIFLGLKLGQTKKEFFDTCWKLNTNQVVTNGADGFVEYTLPTKGRDRSDQEITMLFYGIFDEENIMTGMKLQFSYDAWSLWNKSLQSDQLLLIVKKLLKEWYAGNDFIKVDIANNKKQIWVKVDGNRRITIKPLDHDRTVKAQIDDLRYVLEK